MIHFAQEFGRVTVVVGGTAEKVPEGCSDRDRRRWVASEFPEVDCYYQPCTKPENVNDVDWWAEKLGVGYYDYVVGSEDYCRELADKLGARFVPYDIGREFTYGLSSTQIRKYPEIRWGQLAPSVKRQFTTRVCLFGQESVGKTTLCRSSYYPHVVEYARPYLETRGRSIHELDSEAYREIIYGQFALEKALEREGFYSPIHLYDTDFWSTIGYMRLQREAGVESWWVHRAWNTRPVEKDLYVIPHPDDVPFERDQLRYGGSVRESTVDFWIDLCKEFRLPYWILHGKTLQERRVNLAKKCRELYEKKVTWKGYQRNDKPANEKAATTS